MFHSSLAFSVYKVIEHNETLFLFVIRHFVLNVVISLQYIICKQNHGTNFVNIPKNFKLCLSRLTQLLTFKFQAIKIAEDNH